MPVSGRTITSHGSGKKHPPPWVAFAGGTADERPTPGAKYHDSVPARMVEETLVEKATKIALAGFLVVFAILLLWIGINAML